MKNGMSNRQNRFPFKSVTGALFPPCIERQLKSASEKSDSAKGAASCMWVSQWLMDRLGWSLRDSAVGVNVSLPVSELKYAAVPAACPAPAASSSSFPQRSGVMYRLDSVRGSEKFTEASANDMCRSLLLPISTRRRVIGPRLAFEALREAMVRRGVEARGKTSASTCWVPVQLLLQLHPYFQIDFVAKNLVTLRPPLPKPVCESDGSAVEGDSTSSLELINLRDVRVFAPCVSLNNGSRREASRKVAYEAVSMESAVLFNREPTVVLSEGVRHMLDQEDMHSLVHAGALRLSDVLHDRDIMKLRLARQHRQLASHIWCPEDVVGNDEENKEPPHVRAALLDVLAPVGVSVSLTDDESTAANINLYNLSDVCSALETVRCGRSAVHSAPSASEAPRKDPHAGRLRDATVEVTEQPCHAVDKIDAVHSAPAPLSRTMASRSASNTTATESTRTSRKRLTMEIDAAQVVRETNTSCLVSSSDGSITVDFTKFGRVRITAADENV